MTDRPVYRPAQTVKFKAWVRHAKYDKDDTSTFAGQRFSVRIHNPKNEQIYSKTLTADAYGGMAGEFKLPADAALGVYRISHNRGSVFASLIIAAVFTGVRPFEWKNIKSPSLKSRWKRRPNR
jgi:hypothetical protein